MPQWTEKTFDATGELLEISWQLRDLASAMGRCGMSNAANELYDAAARIKAAQEQIRGAVGQECYDSFRRAEESSAAMLEAVLVGAERLNERLKSE